MYTHTTHSRSRVVHGVNAIATEKKTQHCTISEPAKKILFSQKKSCFVPQKKITKYKNSREQSAIQRKTRKKFPTLKTTHTENLISLQCGFLF
jgi:hypothetical protein